MKKEALYRKLRPLLSPFAGPYARIMQKRRSLYENGQKDRYRPSCPCISVGNIAWGGTGKTPVTEWLLRYAKQAGRKAVVLSRGYGGTPGPAPVLVSAQTPTRTCGDEPLMLALRHPEAAIIVHPRRALSARYADSALHPGLFIIDDGMQHLALERDINLVLLRPEDLDDEWNRVIPSGSWREDASALASASAFLIKADEAQFSAITPLVRERLSTFGVPVFSFTLHPSGLSPLFPGKKNAADAEKSTCTNDLEMIAPEEYADRPYILVSGVGNPAGVADTATEIIGRPPAQHIAYDDHHAYSSVDVQALTKISPVPLPVVCTPKDAVKLRSFPEEWGNVPVYVLETEARFGPALFTDDPFPVWLENALAALKK